MCTGCGGCRRDVKDKCTPPVCTFLRPSCVQKTRLTNDSEVSSPSIRRISAYVRVVVLGVLRRAVFWAENSALPKPPPPFRHLAGTVRPWSEMHTAKAAHAGGVLFGVAAPCIRSTARVHNIERTAELTSDRSVLSGPGGLLLRGDENQIRASIAIGRTSCAGHYLQRRASCEWGALPFPRRSRQRW